MLIAPNTRTRAVFYDQQNNKVTKVEVLFFNDSTNEPMIWDNNIKMLKGINREDKTFLGLIFGDSPNNFEIEKIIEQKLKND